MMEVSLYPAAFIARALNANDQLVLTGLGLKSELKIKLRLNYEKAEFKVR